jgi:hypothetical protein
VAGRIDVKTRELMKQRYTFGDVCAALARIDRMVHRAYADDPNREVGTVQRAAWAKELRGLGLKLFDAAGAIEPAPAPRSVLANPNDPLGPRLLLPEPLTAEQRAKLLDPVENARAALALFHAGAPNARAGWSSPSLSVGSTAIEKRPVPWWNLYWRVRLWWTARHDEEE